MRALFADTYYYLAILNPRDKAHGQAVAFSQLAGRRSVTTDWVLTEVADALALPESRSVVRTLVDDLRATRYVTIVPAGRELFERGLALYVDRPDKAWSLTDCISFVVMDQEHLTEALTADHHFEQAGFTALLK